MLVLTLVVFVISIAGVTYAYFGSSVIGNEEASSAKVKTTKKQLTYTDVLMISDSNTLPGWSQTKTFTVTNTGRKTASYNIIWRDITNSLTNDELVISATCSASSGSCSGISETPVYYTTREQSIKRIKKNISIEPGITHTYTVTIEFIDTDSNQDYNQRKSFRGFLNIEDSDSEVKMLRSGTDSTTGLPVVTIGTEEFYDITNAIDYTDLMNTNGDIYNYSEGKSVLLAKYNLYVGITEDGSSQIISNTDPEYGLQNSNAGSAIAYNLNKKPNVVQMKTRQKLAGPGGSSPPPSPPPEGTIGTYYSCSVPFSNVDYWYDSTNSTIYSKYGTTLDKNNVYDTDYSGTNDWSNSGYSIAYYVEEYVNTLRVSGIGRLLTYTEFKTLTNTQRDNGTYYWLATGYSSTAVFFSYSANSIWRYNSADVAGVRPVIVVDTADIKDIPVRAGTDSDTGLPKVMIGTETFLDLTNTINYSSLDSTFKEKINYDSSKSILLAKYNLYVGQNCTSSDSCTPISTSASGYGLQSVDAKGYVSSSSMIAVAPFASYNGRSYWDPQNNIKPQYGTYTNGENNVYDTNYMAAPNYSVAFYSNVVNANLVNANYSIAYYVEQYASRLGLDGMGRLLTYPEFSALTTTQRTNGAHYWLGSSPGEGGVYALNNVTGNVSNNGSPCWTWDYYGVRPVIVVNTSDIQSS